MRRAWNPGVFHHPCVFYYNDVYKVPLPQGHRFPMEKYRMVRERLQSLLPQGGAVFEVSPLATTPDLCLVHDRAYVNRYRTGAFTDAENRMVGFPWSIDSVNRSLSSVGGTVAATHMACTRKAFFAAHLAGGTHHAFRDRGEGFCIFSDIAVAATVALCDYPEIIKRYAILLPTRKYVS